MEAAASLRSGVGQFLKLSRLKLTNVILQLVDEMIYASMAMRYRHTAFRGLVIATLVAMAGAGPSAALEVKAAFAASGNATVAIQGLLDAGLQVVIPCDGVTSVTGLTVPAVGAAIRGECPDAVLHVAANAPAIDCTGGRPLSVTGLTITGTGPDYTGHGTGPSLDAGQRGIHIDGCPARIANVRLKNIDGNAIDYENSAFKWSANVSATFSDIAGENNYRLIFTHGFGEYASFSNIHGHNNVVAIEVASGNVSFTGVVLLYNSVGIKISGSASSNPCHGSFSGGSSNHNTYNLVVTSCGVGEVFNGMQFIGDQSGAITAGARNVLIFNSRGVTIANGQIGCNVALVDADPVTGDVSLNGANLLSGNYLRDDLANYVPPTAAPGTTLIKHGNYAASSPASDW